jgi:hypothetical protein
VQVGNGANTITPGAGHYSVVAGNGSDTFVFTAP